MRAHSISKRFFDQRGVAMVTVLLVGAALTVVSSAAAFMTIGDLRAGMDDRNGSEALAFAEAGIDRMMLLLRGGTLTWGDIRLAGCDPDADGDPDFVETSGTVGANGAYSARLEVYNPGATGADRFTPTSCSTPSTGKPDGHSFIITSTGQRPAARRIVQQQIRIGVVGLPVGIYADGLNSNGNPDLFGISVVVNGEIEGREKLSFAGQDPYYTLHAFYENGDFTKIPAAPHATGRILVRGRGPFGSEHPPNPRCDTNGGKGAAGQSLWDGSSKGTTLTTGCTNWAGTPAGFPPRSLFTVADLERVAPEPKLDEQDYLTLKQMAKSEGLYCEPNPALAGKYICILQKANGTVRKKTDTTIIDKDLLDGRRKVFVAYIDNPSNSDPVANLIRWKAEVKYCDDDPDLNESVVLVDRYGSLTMQSGGYLTGAILAQEGQIDIEGGFTLHGTVIAKKLLVRGDAQFIMDDCWVQNMPGPFLDATPVSWHQVDR